MIPISSSQVVTPTSPPTVEEQPSLDLTIKIPEDSNVAISEEKKKQDGLTPRTIEKMKKSEFLGNGPLVATIWKMTYPDLVAKVVSSLYTLVDSICIGQFAGDTVEERKISLAGQSFASPIEMCIMVGLSLIFAQGGGPLYGRYLGRRDEKTARRVVGNTFTMDIILGIVMAIVLPLIAEWLLVLLGASEAAGTLEPAKKYIYPLMYADILYNFCYGTNNLMRGEGAALYSCSLMLISAIINMIFDFIFLKFLGLGIQGAAFATIIAYICSSSFGLWFFLSKRSAVIVRLKDMIPDWKLVLEIMNTGLSGMVIGLSNGIMTIVSNQLVLNFSPYPRDDPLTVAAIAASGSLSRMQYFLFIPINSIAHGCVALLAYCRGAKLSKRFINALRVCFIGQLIVCIILSAGCLVFSNQLATLFNSDEEFIKIFSKGLRYMTALLFLSPFSCTLYPGLQAIGRGFGAAVVLFGRSCLFTCCAQFIMCWIRQDYWGTFMAYPFADIVAALFATIYYFCVRKEIHGEERKKELPIQCSVCFYQTLSWYIYIYIVYIVKENTRLSKLQNKSPFSSKSYTISKFIRFCKLAQWHRFLRSLLKLKSWKSV
ncbi:uncharacterized protein [Blastocystis hominis]|uniref:MATE efflux family protein n=1 Tax=Blastocystis hominis TaxID=12968 RepID=D8MBM2_BLAHO|nr:uncharacterized protein [Blastocystis hominis]CBK25461.2 unnamed protein product [Blastocystis hominis]|eukprot:XP_012899509.1 uncharacterized protein [Blastocystis hominis]